MVRDLFHGEPIAQIRASATADDVLLHIHLQRRDEYGSARSTDFFIFPQFEASTGRKYHFLFKISSVYVKFPVRRGTGNYGRRNILFSLAIMVDFSLAQKRR
jgi:hypothetical protein